MWRTGSDVEHGGCEDDKWNSISDTAIDEDAVAERQQSGSETERTDRIRRSRNTGTAPGIKQSVRALKKADSFPILDSLRKLHSGLKDGFTLGRRTHVHESPMMKRRSSVPGAFKAVKRRSTVGKMLSTMLPPNFSPLLGQEDDEDDLWFTALEDFNPPIIILEESNLRTSYFVKAAICKRNFVMHEYLKENLSAGDDRRVRRLLDFMQWLRHPNIIKCMGAWEEDSAFYVIEEYCHRSNLLQQMVTSKKTFTEEFVANKLLKPLLDVLTYLHDVNIAHRSVIPENVQFGKGNVLRLTGFFSAIECTRSRPCSRLGPIDYTPPEVLGMPEETDLSMCSNDEEDETPEYDEKMDVWQLGVLAYELLGGRCPFEIADPVLSSCMISWAELHPFPREFSPGAVDFIQKTLKKEPHLRPTVRELSEHPWLQSFAARKSQPGEKKNRSISFWKRIRRGISILAIIRHWASRVSPFSPREEPMDKNQLPDSDIPSRDLPDDERDSEQLAEPMMKRLSGNVAVHSILNIDLDTADQF